MSSRAAKSLHAKQASGCDKMQKVFPDLSDREYEILQLIAQGKSNKEIAAILYLAEPSVRVYCTILFRKLGVATRTQAALKFLAKLGHEEAMKFLTGKA